MKILIVSAIPISYPPKDGYSMVVFYRSYFLKKLYNIESDIILAENENSSHEKLLASGIFSKVFTYPTKNKWLSLFLSFFLRLPYNVIRFSPSSSYIKKYISSLKKEQYQGVIFDHSYSYLVYKRLTSLLNIPKEKMIYWSHNIDFLDIKYNALESKNLLKKLLYLSVYRKLKKIETSYIKNFSKIVSVSKHEVPFLKTINPSANVEWIPPILPKADNASTPIHSELRESLEKQLSFYKHKILFTGILMKPSNIEPAIWFAENVLPIIKTKDKCCFIIAGKDPSKKILNLAQKYQNVIIVPNPPSMEPLYHIADIVIVPLKNPAGIKLKLIEALNYRKKVVATKEALVGAGLEELVPYGENPKDFAKKCQEVLENQIDYDSIFTQFNSMYDYSTVCEKIKNFL
ncbi:MAG: glycosyltransferase family 4 protein [Brevinematales bacterium]|nr:glycosyltransferase family 4 protein [Brevinematales bacterium]